ncbi:uncharacterized protein LOC112089728 [Eutrema salsugineum]|uniref:uncharacterized protein LOC112089728 n=1 Tax=Eutrema salsugineum TaxID=72664 RepID=UPI000CED0979|nr:uncharacterized protein LOC112089728 [Eutrema salsugineum]
MKFNEIVGESGHLDLGIQKHAKVGEVLATVRRRRHHQHTLNDIELEIHKLRQSGTDDEDVAKWKARDGNYKAKFVTRDTWYQIRTAKPSVNWYKGVWFSQSTPKYTFMSWLAFQNRLATGERIATWNINANTGCVLCNEPIETRNHLFFSCSYSMKVWEQLAKGLLKHRFVSDWERITVLLFNPPFDKTTTYLF